MAKAKKQQRRRKTGHVRLNCPHCTRNVSVQRPRAFQRSMPCPNCRIPIANEFIITASESSAENDVAPVQEESSEESVTEETAETPA